VCSLRRASWRHPSSCDLNVWRTDAVWNGVNISRRSLLSQDDDDYKSTRYGKSIRIVDGESDKERGRGRRGRLCVFPSQTVVSSFVALLTATGCFILPLRRI
jgi:hypothetical protein